MLSQNTRKQNKKKTKKKKISVEILIIMYTKYDRSKSS